MRDEHYHRLMYLLGLEFDGVKLSAREQDELEILLLLRAAA